jgi:hypothetical protein
MNPQPMFKNPFKVESLSQPKQVFFGKKMPQAALPDPIQPRPIQQAMPQPVQQPAPQAQPVNNPLTQPYTSPFKGVTTQPVAPVVAAPRPQPQVAAPQVAAPAQRETVKVGMQEFPTTANQDLSKMTSTQLRELGGDINAAYDTQKNQLGSGSDLMTLPNLTGQQGLITNQQNVEMGRVSDALNTQKELEAQQRAERLAAIRAGASSSSKAEKELLAKQGRAQAATNQINLINEALNNKPGLQKSVGVGIFSRMKGLRPGKSADFTGAVKQLTDSLTMDNLIKAKQNGATFGALSDGERRMLAASATKLNEWEIKGKDGLPTGKWRAREDSVRNELKKIQDFAKIDYERATGMPYQDVSSVDTSNPEIQQLLDSGYTEEQIQQLMEAQ